MGECTEGAPLCAKFHPHRCNNKGIEPPKPKILLRFYQNSEYKRPAGAYPLRDFYAIRTVGTSFHIALAVKTWMDFLRGYGIIGVLRGSGYPQTFRTPSGKTVRQTPKVFEVQERTRGPLSPHQV